MQCSRLRCDDPDRLTAVGWNHSLAELGEGDLTASGLYVYDPATDTWSGKAEMPGIRDAYGDLLFSGMSGPTGVIAGQLYTLSDCWTTGGVIGKKFYAVGDHVEVYDPVTNRWTTKRAPTRALGGRCNGDAESNLRRGWFRIRQRRHQARSPRPVDVRPSGGRLDVPSQPADRTRRRGGSQGLHQRAAPDGGGRGTLYLLLDNPSPPKGEGLLSFPRGARSRVAATE